LQNSSINDELHLQIIQEGIEKAKNVDTKLGSWDLVTEYDRRVEIVLITEISRKFPSHK
jgi:fructose-1,6-bisphosphatase/inositol monophosphatase family enzyme